VPSLTSFVALDQNRTPAHFRLPYIYSVMKISEARPR
jgi:hypothetical protein